MVRQRVLIAVRSILTGWAMLLTISYLLERPLLFWSEPVLGGSWFSTAQLALDCCSFTATGWAVSYWSRADSLFPVLAFAATLIPWDLNPVLDVNVPWLLHLVVETFRDTRYLDSLVATAGSHILLFGSLIVGSRLGRPSGAALVSVFHDVQR